ncbi:MAG: hypothetical protein J6Y54_01350 [Lentisphaeria bacterium]|nr:hypothetical protein [Lentisphaeria bacterium]
MKRHYWLFAVNIRAKSIGAILGGAACLSQCEKFDGEPMDMAILAGYCALGYMAGNLVTAAAILLGLDAAADEDEE